MRSFGYFVLGMVIAFGTVVAVTPGGPVTVDIKIDDFESPSVFSDSGTSTSNPTEPLSQTPISTAQSTATIGTPLSSPTSTASPTPTPADSDSTIDRAALEAELHLEINQVRSEQGLSSLELDPRLREAARMHSRDMAENEFVDHEGSDGSSFSDRYDAVGYDCEVPLDDGRIATGGENIAMQTAVGDEGEIAEAIVTGWMTSEGHRENILRDYWRSEGIGVAVGNGRVYVTQNFC